jgi:hypothetical protein
VGGASPGNNCRAGAKIARQNRSLTPVNPAR